MNTHLHDLRDDLGTLREPAQKVLQEVVPHVAVPLAQTPDHALSDDIDYAYYEERARTLRGRAIRDAFSGIAAALAKLLCAIHSAKARPRLLNDVRKPRSKGLLGGS